MGAGPSQTRVNIEDPGLSIGQLSEVISSTKKVPTNTGPSEFHATFKRGVYYHGKELKNARLRVFKYSVEDTGSPCEEISKIYKKVHDHNIDCNTRDLLHSQCGVATEDIELVPALSNVEPGLIMPGYRYDIMLLTNVPYPSSTLAQWLHTLQTNISLRKHLYDILFQLIFICKSLFLHGIVHNDLNEHNIHIVTRSRPIASQFIFETETGICTCTHSSKFKVVLDNFDHAKCFTGIIRDHHVHMDKNTSTAEDIKRPPELHDLSMLLSRAYALCSTREMKWCMDHIHQVLRTSDETLGEWKQLMANPAENNPPAVTYSDILRHISSTISSHSDISTTSICVNRCPVTILVSAGMCKRGNEACITEVPKTGHDDLDAGDSKHKENYLLDGLGSGYMQEDN